MVGHAFGIIGVVLAISAPALGQELVAQMVEQNDLLNVRPCIHVIALQDDFATSRPGTNTSLALAWHSYAQGVGDALFPNEKDAFVRAMAGLFEQCLKSPGEPISVAARALALTW